MAKTKAPPTARTDLERIAAEHQLTPEQVDLVRGAFAVYRQQRWLEGDPSEHAERGVIPHDLFYVSPGYVARLAVDRQTIRELCQFAQQQENPTP